MSFVEVVVDGKVVSRRDSNFGDKELSQQVADAVKGKNIRNLVPPTSRQRRKAKANGDQQ